MVKLVVLRLLLNEKISYQWGFPFKLIVNYNNSIVIIRKIQEAEQFLKWIQKQFKDTRRNRCYFRKQDRDRDREGNESINKQLNLAVSP